MTDSEIAALRREVFSLRNEVSELRRKYDALTKLQDRMDAELQQARMWIEAERQRIREEAART